MKFDKKIKVKMINLIGATLFITSTTYGYEGRAKTKEYYTAHLDEAKQTVEKCKKLETASEIEAKECAAAKTVMFFHSGKKTIKGDEKNIKTW